MQKQKGRYTIGEYSFETFHEYREGQEDVRKIECINKELNIQDPEVAVRLYNDIRSGKITFKSPIGDQFFAHLADVVADKSVGLLEDKAVIEEAEGKVKYQKMLGMVFISLAIVSFAVFGIASLRDIITTRKMQQMSSQVQQNAQDNQKNEEQTGDNPDKIDADTLTVLPEYESLLQQNPDMVGWIKIDGTDIDLPVVQRDNTYYLDHSFEGKENANGCIFVDDRCDIVNPTTNTIVYGHNMKSGMMFGGLKQYLQEGYLDAHKMIQFSTIYEHRQYEIVAVGLSKVQYQDDNSYRYYDFIDAQSDEDFKEFVDNINQLAVFGDAGVLTKSDKIITLSTCNSYTEDGRLFVVAKQIN
ncbi:MAG: class B sortase [Lachnospiraceae bacterium]|nr:class B sortase [Lachnospiraceae bacterium]